MKMKLNMAVMGKKFPGNQEKRRLKERTPRATISLKAVMKMIPNAKVKLTAKKSRKRNQNVVVKIKKIHPVKNLKKSSSMVK